MKKWVNVELSGSAADKFRTYLLAREIRFETSGAGTYTHFEVYMNNSEIEAANAFLETL